MVTASVIGLVLVLVRLENNSAGYYACLPPNPNSRAQTSVNPNGYCLNTCDWPLYNCLQFFAMIVN